MAIVGVLVNSIKGIGGGGGQTMERNNQLATSPSSPITMVQVQVGLLASAKSLQEDLRDLAKSADTNTTKGLQRVLQDTTLALLRQPDLWVYSNTETGQVPFNSAEATFNQLSITERSKLSAEVTSNYSGELIKDDSIKAIAGEAAKTSEFIVVTLLIASKKHLKVNQTATSEQLRENLRIIGSLSSEELIALEVIWQPDGLGDNLSTEELITSYPNLLHL